MLLAIEQFHMMLQPWWCTKTILSGLRSVLLKTFFLFQCSARKWNALYPWPRVSERDRSVFDSFTPVHMKKLKREKYDSIPYSACVILVMMHDMENRLFRPSTHKWEAGVFKSPSWGPFLRNLRSRCPKTPFRCKWKAKRENKKSVSKIIQIQRYPYVCTGQYGCVNRPFPGTPGLCFKTRLSAQPLICKWFFILMQIKLIFTRKVVHLASFWKWGFWNSEVAHCYVIRPHLSRLGYFKSGSAKSKSPALKPATG